MMKDLAIIYSTDAEILRGEFSSGNCLHLICLEGNGNFVYGERHFGFVRNDLIIISRPDLMKDLNVSHDFKMECLVAPLKFLYNQLPANHYGIGGCISLWTDPVISLSDADVDTILNDFRKLHGRICDKNHRFYKELIGSLALTMVYDLFDVHARRDGGGKISERKADLVSELTKLLSSGKTRQNREVAYYASLLNVSPKYLGNVVRRQTGRSVSFLIDQHTVPMIIKYLKNSKLTQTQIADEFNFTSLSYFCRYVKKHLGMSPSEYRASLQPKKRE